MVKSPPVLSWVMFQALPTLLVLAGTSAASSSDAQLYRHPPGVECYCTDSEGGRVELGELRCLSVGARQFTAQCQMSLNVPMWREISEGCANS